MGEFVLRFNRGTARAISHGFGRLIQHGVKTQPSTLPTIFHGNVVGGFRRGTQEKYK